MSLNPAELWGSERQILVFLPTVSFGYLFVKSGEVWFLVASVFTVIGATFLLETRFRQGFTYDQGPSLHKIAFFICVFPWMVAYPASAYFLFEFLGEGNWIAVALFLATVVEIVSFFWNSVWYTRVLEG